MDEKETFGRKDFWTKILKEVVSVGREMKACFDEGRRTVGEEIPFDQFPLAGTYPRELYEEEAIKLGINIDEVGESEALRRIIEFHNKNGT